MAAEILIIRQAELQNKTPGAKREVVSWLIPADSDYVLPDVTPKDHNGIVVDVRDDDEPIRIHLMPLPYKLTRLIGSQAYDKTVIELAHERQEWQAELEVGESAVYAYDTQSYGPSIVMIRNVGEASLRSETMFNHTHTDN
jgi:O-succinylbenzoate synthase